MKVVCVHNDNEKTTQFTFLDVLSLYLLPWSACSFYFSIDCAYMCEKYFACLPFLQYHDWGAKATHLSSIRLPKQPRLYKQLSLIVFKSTTAKSSQSLTWGTDTISISYLRGELKVTFRVFPSLEQVKGFIQSIRVLLRLSLTGL